MQFGGLLICRKSRRCRYDNGDVPPTDREFDLWWLLGNSSGEVLSGGYLTRQLRGIDYDGIDRTIDNRIVTLRKKLSDDATNPKGIITVRGKGYLFVADGWKS